MMNKSIKILIILISCLLLTACWNYREINSLYIVAGAAIDKSPNTNQYNLTTELVNIKENIKEQSFESLLLESKGDSILNSVRKMVRVSAKKPYWAHATTIIISEEVAREGIMPFLDLIARDYETRLDSNIYISREKTAKEILELQSLSTDIRSFELAIMVNQSMHLVKTPALKAYQVINGLAIPKVHIVLPTVMSFSNNGENTNLLSGGAVFSKGKLVGFLDQENIIPYLFITNRIKEGILNVKTGNDNPNDTIILEVFDSNTKIKPIYDSEKLGFDIFIKARGTIAEVTTMTDYISPKGRKNLKILAEKSLKAEIENNIKHVQKEFGFDIFGFGNIIRQKNYKLWEQIEKDWDYIFMNLDLNIHCDIEIRNSGHFLNPIKVVD